MTRIQQQQRRDRIVSAAAALFAEHGYATTSMSDVATAARASKETLYSYFGDKPGLLRAVFESLIAGSSAPKTSVFVVDDEGLESILTRVAIELIDDLMTSEYLSLARIVVAEVPRDAGLGDAFREAVAMRVLARVGLVLESARQAGLIERSVDTSAAARGFVGSLLTYVLLDGLLRHPHDIRRPDHATIATQVEVFIRGIADDSATPPRSS